MEKERGRERISSLLHAIHSRVVTHQLMELTEAESAKGPSLSSI
jgi:hypothetical protein